MFSVDFRLQDLAHPLQSYVTVLCAQESDIANSENPLCSSIASISDCVHRYLRQLSPTTMCRNKMVKNVNYNIQ